MLDGAVARGFASAGGERERERKRGAERERHRQQQDAHAERLLDNDRPEGSVGIRHLAGDDQRQPRGGEPGGRRRRQSRDASSVPPSQASDARGARAIRVPTAEPIARPLMNAAAIVANA